MFDVHCHLIYQEDDGSRSIEESIKMIEKYIEVGYKGAIVTPHYDRNRYLVTSDIVLDKMEILKNKIKEENIDFELFPGNEIQIDEKTIDLIKNKEIFRLNNSRYVLCELPFFSKPIYAKELFYQMRLEGWIPIIAHPERYSYVKEDIGWLKQFIKTGCLLQLNISSLSSKMNSNIAKQLLERNMIHLVGTDSHQNEWRSPDVKKEFIILRELVGDNKFETLTSTNPKKIIDDLFIPSNYEKILDSPNNQKKKKWFKFWR